MKVDQRYRGVPFWCWNGDLEREEIIRQVHVLKQMGFGGFFMHSRTGLVTEYLGNQWFELIRAATEEAEKLGMSAWLYDEDRWPSGTAGGEVTKTPEYQLKFISMYDNEIVREPGVLYGEHLGAFACKFNCRNELVDYYLLQNGENAAEGYAVREFVVEHMKPNDFYNGYTYADTTNRAATDAFLRLTHEKYREKCGDLFGKTLIGIFTDEPHRGGLMNGFGIDNKNRERMAPYSYELFERFRALCGDNLAETLPELFYRREGVRASRTMYYYIESLQQLFLQNFAIPYHEWCRRNNLIATGHILHEDSLAIQTLFQGSVQRYYEHMDYPGVDILTEGNRAYWVAKQVQSVARQMGQKFVLSELYGCTGWQFNFRSHRDVGAWQTLLGINLRCHHLSWYTMEGEAKRDYPASIFYQSGWYADYPYIEDYFARLGEITSKGKAQCETLVINPVESMWLYPRAGWQKNLFELQVPEGQRLEEAYVRLFDILTTGQVAFDYGDEDILARHARVQKEHGQAGLCVGQARYTTVVLGGMDTVRASTLNLLRELIAAGGQVLFVGDLPAYVDALPAPVPEDILRASAHVPLEREPILNYFADRRFFTIDSDRIITTVREENAAYYLVCLNADRDRAQEGLTLRLNNSYNVEEIRMETGVEFGVARGVTQIPVRFEPGECRVFRIFVGGEILPCASAETPTEERLLEGPFAYTLNEPNILPLDLATYSLDGVAGEGESEILRIDRAVRTKLGLPLRGGEMKQPWFRKKYAGAEHAKSHKISLTFRFFAETVPSGELHLNLEQSERWKISINGEPFAAAVAGHWIDPCFDRLPLPSSRLRTGENEIKMTADYDETLNLECMYLTGNFGVRVEGRKTTLCQLPETLSAGDLNGQGLPFYSGSVTYHTNCANRRVSVRFGDCYGAVCKVKGEGHSECVAFAPYESGVFDCGKFLDLEVVLTRRNTFGPLHFPPLVAGGYGPELYVLDGEGYAPEYCLLPQGLLQAATVKVYDKTRRI